jgi:hypothetical protein
MFSFSKGFLPLVTGMALMAMLVACATQTPGGVLPAEARLPAAHEQGAQPFVAYSALQVIDTVPGPFENRIYVAADRERQDASLGGGVVTTIIRRDKGVAWLLVPGKKAYEEVALDAAASASVQARFAGLQKKVVSRQRLDGLLATQFACYDSNGRYVADLWMTDNGIALKSEFFEDPLAGQPRAVVSLKQLRIEPQDASLFELPAGYHAVNGR